MSGTCSDGIFVFNVFFYSSILFTIISATDCDESKCLGPLRYYKDLQCKPVYRTDGDCCAIRYDCSHLYQRSVDMCYANGTSYAVGDIIQKKDQLNPCLIGCSCQKYDKEVAKFTCSDIDCMLISTKPECYIRRKFESCCGNEFVCPENLEDRIKCVVDGKTYFDGDIFYPNSDPRAICQCLDGYKGENVLPYCRKFTCGVEEHEHSKIYEKCAPLYSVGSSPYNTCTRQFRCQRDNDTIINPKDKNLDENDEMFCEFGSMKLRIGEELNQSNYFTSNCVKCKCEVPPTLTCQRLTKEECKIKFQLKN